MAFPDTVITDNESAGAFLTNKAKAAGLDISGLSPVAQLQCAVGNLLVSDPSSVTIPAGDILSGTFGANKVGGADTGTYTFPGALVLTGSLTGVTSLAIAGALTGATTGAFSSTLTSTAHTITSASATSLAVGLAGATNPAFAVDSSTALQVAGLKVKGAITTGTVAISVTDTGAGANLIIDAQGTGTIGIGSVSTGAVTITPATTITGALTASSTASCTGFTFTLSAKSTTALATPSALAATQWTGFASTVSGAAVMGFGTTNDVSLMNRAGTVCLGVGPNTTTVNVIGNFVATTAGSEIILANTALATNATAGFVYIASCAGTPTGVPGSAAAGKIAIVYDTTGHKFWAYDQVATAWKSVALT